MIVLSPTKKCKYCGEPVPSFEPPECTNCWEVMKRLGEFLEHKINRDHVKALLKEYADG